MGAIPQISSLASDLMNDLKLELWIVNNENYPLSEGYWQDSKPARCSDQIPDTCRQSGRAHPKNPLGYNDKEVARHLGGLAQSIQIPRHMWTEKDPCVTPNDPLWQQCAAVSGVKTSSDKDSAVIGHLWKTEGLERLVWSLWAPAEDPLCVSSE